MDVPVPQPTPIPTNCLEDEVSLLDDMFNDIAEMAEKVLNEKAFTWPGVGVLAGMLATCLGFGITMATVEGGGGMPWWSGPIGIVLGLTLAVHALLVINSREEVIPMDPSVFMAQCRCPLCGLEDMHAIATRTAIALPKGLVADVARECADCGHLWGQRVLTGGVA